VVSNGTTSYLDEHESWRFITKIFEYTQIQNTILRNCCYRICCSYSCLVLNLMVTDLCSIGTLFAFVLVQEFSATKTERYSRKFKTPYVNSKYVIPLC
jgi:hypothetical protein